MKMFSKRNGWPCRKNEVSLRKGFPNVIVCHVKWMSFLYEKVFHMKYFALQIEWVFYTKREGFGNAKRNEFPIWNSLLCKRNEFPYMKSFPCKLVYSVKRKSIPCKKKKLVFSNERWLVTLLSCVLPC